MALAALVLSVLALLAAGASALYTKRQADAATLIATLDAERRHEERTPTFDAWIEPVNDGTWHRLWLRLTSPQGLSAVEATITEGAGVEFTTGQYGVDPGALPPVLHASTMDETGAKGLAPDERTCWQVRFSQSPKPSEFRIRISAAQNDSTWNVTIPVRTPREPTVW